MIDWMEEDLNENLQMIVGSLLFHRKIEGFFKIKHDKVEQRAFRK